MLQRGAVRRIAEYNILEGSLFGALSTNGCDDIQIPRIDVTLLTLHG